MSSSSPPSNEELRKLLKPKPSHEQVIDVLKKSYECKEVEIIKELDSYDDCNYMVKMDGTLFLAKIHNGVESNDFMNVYNTTQDYHTCGADSVIHFQNGLMEHLNQHGIATSCPQLTLHKSPVSVHTLPVVSSPPQPLVLRLLSWVPGRTMSSLPVLPLECLADAGRFLGNMDHKLDLLDSNCYKASKRHHEWDGKNTADLRPFIPCIPDSKRRMLVESVINTFEIDLKGVHFREGILQADFNDANILVNDDFQVSGVIDFGDSVASWRVLDISVAMMYAMLTSYGKADRRLSAACAVLRGYHAVYPLQDVELQHLHLLVACRLACSATLGAYSYQQNPQNEYLLLHAEPAWKTLELIWGYDLGYRNQMKETLSRMFDVACSKCSELCNGVIYCSDLTLPDPNVKDLIAPLRLDVKQADTLMKSDGGESKPTITFCTGNKKKLEEVKRLLNKSGTLPFTITNLKVDLPELQGEPIEIAKEKCAVAAVELGGPVITEDTSLCFSALKDLPGPYIKWFLEKLGHDGLNDMIQFSSDKSGYAQTVVAFCPGPRQPVTVFDGRVAGKIVRPRGDLDFGWDPIFEPSESGEKTFAEMSSQSKDAISHRGRAFALLRDYFTKESESITASISSAPPAKRRKVN